MGGTTTDGKLAGTYHYHQDPIALLNQLDPGNTGQHASPIIGWSFDGYPIYGPYGYANADDPTGTGAVERMTSSYQLRNITTRTTLANGTTLPTSEDGPAVSTTYPLGSYLEDYQYVSGSGVLDQYNGRYVYTPQFPNGTYAYFLSTNSAGTSVYPYIIGPDYYGVVDANDLLGGKVTVPGNAVIYVPPANLTWNNTSGTGNGTTWDTTSSNWNNGSSATTFSSTDADNVTFNDTNNGHYAVTINTTVTPGSTTVNNSNGNYIFSGTGGISGTGALTKSGTGSLTLATTNSYYGGTNVSAGTLILSGSGAFPANTALTIGTGGTLQIAAHTGGSANIVVVMTGQLTFSGTTGSWGGLLDLTNNSLIVRGGSLSDVTSQIATAYAGGTWAGAAGITSSTAAASTSHLTAVGVIKNDNAGKAIYTTFDGVSTVDGDILVKYTYYGDANLDGAVDGSDYSKIDAGFNSAGALTGWANGDFNYDGAIDGSDYTLIDNAFNTQSATLGSNPATLIAGSTAQIADPSSAVPEPAMSSLLAILAIGTGKAATVDGVADVNPRLLLMRQLLFRRS